MRKSLQLLIISVLFFTFFQSLYAESFSIRKYNYQNGLPSDKVVSVRQDKFGNMWIGTTRGLVRFDGSEFYHFSKQQRGAKHLSHNLAQAILPMENGDVWVATPDSLNIYDYKKDRMRTMGSESGLTYPDVTALAHGSGCEWVGTFGKGLFRFDYKTKRFKPVKVVNSLGGTEQIMSLCEDSNRQLWIGTRYNGVFLYNLHTGECRKIKGKDAESTFINTIFQDLSGTIWIGSSTGFYYVQGGLLVEVEAPEFKGKCVFGITEQPAGTIWLAGEEIFLNFKTVDFFESPVHPKTTSLTKLIFKDNNALKGLHSIFADDHKNVWVGTYGNGLNILTSNRIFQYILPESSLPFGNTPTTVLDIQTNHKGQLWIAKETSGLINFNTHEQRVENSIPFDDNSIKSICEDKKGNLWVGGYRKGLAFRKKGESRFVRLSKDIGIQVRKIFQASDNSIYVSSNEGLLKSITEGASWLKVHTKWFSKNPDVRCMVEAPDKMLWMGTYNTGLLCYDPLKNSLKQFFVKNGLKSNIIYDLYLDKDILWIATDEGLDSYSFSKKKFNRIFPCDLLSGVTVYAIQKDLSGDLWFSTSSGIANYKSRNKEFTNFSFNGLPPVGEFSEGCSVIDKEGNIYFGASNGILFVRANKNANDEFKHELLFTKLMLFDQQVTPKDESIGNNPLKENLNIQRSFSISANQPMFSIHFSVPFFDSEVTYSYRLEGIDHDWNQLGTQNWVTFRNLEPKKYKLQVRAFISNHDNPIEASLNFVVNPPLWLSWWAKLLYLILIFSISGFFWRQSKERLKLSHTIELEQAFRRRDEEIHEAKLVFFTNISHELRTPLTLLIAPLEGLIGNESNPVKQRTLNLISKNANRLLLLVNQILDFRKNEKGEMKLQVHKVSLNQWGDEIIQSFSEMAKEAGITLNHVYPSNSENVWMDSALMEKVCFNLLSNAFKFTKAGGQVSFIVSVDEKWLNIKVIDNGVGIRNESKEQVFNRFFQEKTLLSSGNKQTGTGIGLHLVKSIVELHHGNISLSSEPGIETVFAVNIPSNEDSYESNEIFTVKASIHDVLNAEELIPVNSRTENIEGKLPQVLVVEDNDELREYLQEALSERYNVISCVNGQEAVDKAHELNIDIIVSDVMMPVMDGFETCKILKSDIETNHIPIILLTAKSGFDDMILGLEKGADAYISKPFNLNHLIAQMNRILENRAILRSKYIMPMQSLLKENKESIESKFMDEITQFILEHITEENLNGNVLANYFRISRTSLHRKLKSVAGLSSGDLIRNIRLAKAAEELVSTEMTISEISFQNGFNSPSYFSLCFTNYFGKSPTAYRTQ